MSQHAADRPALQRIAALVSLACLSLQAQAQSTPPVHATLPTVVVSGSGQNNLLADDLPLSADVIEGQALSDQQIHTLRQALQDLPNTAVRSTPADLMSLLGE